MCGIAGFFGTKKIDTESINNTLVLMKNRGPDFSSYTTKALGNNRFINLLHSRLSIIDLQERSNQPFSIDDYTIIYNGEIYNYVELKKDLEKKGIKFRTNSDTEVLLQYYILYGEECVKFLDGMWSFAIYNHKKNLLFLSRDRFAEKPMYYSVQPEGIYFGSQISFIKGLSKKKFKKNEKKINEFLSYGPKSIFKDNETFYKNINFLGYSENLICNDEKNIKITKYWDPKFKINNNINRKDILTEVKNLLIETVKLRIRADVPAAFCLSGGIDSGALASIATKELNYKIKTFSIIDEDLRYNEEVNIKKVVKDLNCDHEILQIKKDNFLSNLSNIIKYHDSPVYSLSQYLQSCLVKSISASGFKIAISGTASDELFSGYYDHYLLHFQCLQNSDELKKHMMAWKKYVEPHIRNKAFKDPNLFIKKPNFRDYIYDHSQTLSKYLISPEKVEFKEKIFTKEHFTNRRLNELFYEQVQPTLNNEDLNSMMYSVENRSPFLNKKLFDFCYSIPPSMLIDNGYTKSILRESMAGILQEDIRTDRMKKGFNCSIKTLIDFNDKNTLEMLFDPKSEVFNFVNINEFKKLFNEDLTKNYFSKFIFVFLSTKLFLEQTN
jgi:asparagine synthase (glutamine-hydrolysing)